MRRSLFSCFEPPATIWYPSLPSGHELKVTVVLDTVLVLVAVVDVAVVVVLVTDVVEV
jgi:hypothetical protein